MRAASDGPFPDEQRTRLLVVEDEMSTVFALRSFFALNGYEVDCASGPRDGMLLLERREYDAVITDLQLTPARLAEGFSIAERARERNPAACIVLLTAYGCDTTERRAKRCGVDLYLTKPIELSALMHAIDASLAGRCTCRQG